MPPPSRIHMNICILTYPLEMDCMFLFSSTACQPFEIYPLLENTIQFLGSCMAVAWLPGLSLLRCCSLQAIAFPLGSPSVLWHRWALSLHHVGFAENIGCFQWSACIFSCLLQLLETYLLPLYVDLRALSLEIAGILWQSFCSLSKDFVIRNFST